MQDARYLLWGRDKKYTWKIGEAGQKCKYIFLYIFYIYRFTRRRRICMIYGQSGSQNHRMAIYVPLNSSIHSC